MKNNLNVMMDINKTITFSISVIAIIISIASILITRRNLKKQLRLGKLEEILEILHYLTGYYRTLFRLFLDFEEAIQLLKEEKELPPYLVELTKYRKGFLEVVDRESVINKISRLKILSNAYLSNSNNMKVKIHTIADIYYNMYMFVGMEGSHFVKKEEDAIIPKPGEMARFIMKLENDIIIEMNLGYERLSKNESEKYFKTKFRNDLDKKS